MEVEFTPGPLWVLDKNFITAWTAMAEKAGKTFAQAAEIRYENIQEKLAAMAPGTNQELKYQLEQELQKIGTPDGTKGGEERKRWFEDWAKRVSTSQENDSGMNFMEQHIRDVLRVDPFNVGHTPSLNKESRIVRVGPLDQLRNDVELHPALEWQDRLAAVAETEGKVLQDDEKNATAQVHFSGPAFHDPDSLTVWLPLTVLTNVSA